jgi:hypothetical protein
LSVEAIHQIVNIGVETREPKVATEGSTPSFAAGLCDLP